MVSISGERAEELDDAPGRKRKFVSSDNISKTEDRRGRDLVESTPRQTLFWLVCHFSKI